MFSCLSLIIQIAQYFFLSFITTVMMLTLSAQRYKTISVNKQTMGDCMKVALPLYCFLNSRNVNLPQLV